MNAKIFFFFTSFIVFSTTGLCQQQTKFDTTNFDTTNLVIRVCVGDLPGQTQELNRDYRPIVCAYNYINGKLKVYDVKGFDLVYYNQTVHNNGNWFNPQMKSIIVDLKTESDLKNLYFNNVELLDTENKNIFIIKGLHSVIQNK